MSELNQGTWTEQAQPVQTDSWSAPPARPADVGMWPGPTANTQRTPIKPEPEETKKFKENYVFFASASLIYAVFYAFCMFKNGSGITFPFFVGGGLVFLCLSLPKLGLTLKKGSIFYMVAIVLLGVSTFCTDDGRIIFFNKLGILLLMMSLMLKQFYNTAGWKLGKFLGSIVVMASASIAELGRPFSDGKKYRQSRPDKTNKKLVAVGMGLLIAMPLLLVVLILLSDADAVFRQMTKKLLDGITIGNIMNVLLRIAFIFFASYAFLAYLCGKTLKEEVKDRKNGEPLVAITVTGLLTLLYLFFSGIQIAGLFLGKLKLPEGYTYAMYAREGFFQLLTVAFMNLIIVLVCLSFFKESKALKIILTVMSLCTFIMMASSAMRMIIYIYYYYMTFLRLLVLWGLTLLALLFLGIVINIFRDKFSLFRYSVVVVTVLYLALSFSHPDYIIARINVANASAQEIDTEKFQDRVPYHDYSYLSNLSADAAPVLVPYMQEQGYLMEAFFADDPKGYARDRTDGERKSRSKIDGYGYFWMEKMKERTENLGIRTFNVSRYTAWKLLKEAGGK